MFHLVNLNPQPLDLFNFFLKGDEAVKLALKLNKQINNF